MTDTISLPLFPLLNGLFPDSILRLNIFEVRYLDLIKKCEKNQTPFGVVFIKNGGEILAAGKTTEFFECGTLAQLQQVTKVQPSLLQVSCLGGLRFKMLSYELGAYGVWYAHVQYLTADSVVDIPPNLQLVANKLGQIIAQAQQTGQTEALPFAPPYRLDECGWVANRVTELLPMQTEEKHELLSINDPKQRLEVLASKIRF